MKRGIFESLLFSVSMSVVSDCEPPARSQSCSERTGQVRPNPKQMPPKMSAAQNLSEVGDELFPATLECPDGFLALAGEFPEGTLGRQPAGGGPNELRIGFREPPQTPSQPV